MRESNSRQRFWRPLSYHLTNPLYINSMRAFHPHILYTFIFCFSIPFSFVPSKLHTDLYKHQGSSIHFVHRTTKRLFPFLYFRKMVISTTLRFVSMSLLRKLFVPHSPDSPFSKLTRCLLVPYFHFSPLLVKPSTD